MINIILVLLLMIAVFVLDLSLQLGDFHGLVFALYMAYGSIGIGVLDLAWALVQYIKGETGSAKLHVALGIIVALVGVGIAYAGNYFFFVAR